MKERDNWQKTWYLLPLFLLLAGTGTAWDGKTDASRETPVYQGKPITAEPYRGQAGQAPLPGTLPKTHLPARDTVKTDVQRKHREDPWKRIEKYERAVIERDNATREALAPIVTWKKETEQARTRVAETGKRYLALKTNIAGWAVTALNAGVEIQAGRRVTIDLPLSWCPWDITRDRAARFFLLQPEARYWFDRPGRGHLVGLHVHAGWFNVKWRHDRYQDTSRPLLGAGISYGYAFPLGSRWGAEFSLGGGYASIKHDTYYNITNGARIDTRSRDYWGITRVGINLVYKFNLK